MKLHILHVNDVHSQLENYMRLGASLRRLRRELQHNGEFVLTFDIGDTLDRVRPETEATLGQVNAAMLAALQCDGWVFGNNEGLTIPVETWPQLIERAQTTGLTANLRQLAGAPFAFFTGHKIYQFGGVKVGVFGLTPNYTLPYEVLGVRPLDPFAEAQTRLKALRHAGCDIVVVLSHLGLREDRRLAAEVPGLDLILGGHTHQFMSDLERVGATAIFQPGKHALAFGHTTLEFDADCRQIVDVSCRPVRVYESDPLDQAMLSAYRGYLPDIETRLAEPVAMLREPLPVDFQQESRLANVLADILYDSYPCDLGLVVSGMLTASLLPGPVEVQHLLGACSTPTRPLLMTLTGAEIKAIIERSIRPEVYHQAGFGYGFRGSVVGYMGLSNVLVKLSTGSEQQTQVSAISVGDRTLNKDQFYRVITSEYLWLAPVFPEFHMGREIEFQKPLMRDLLIAHLRDPKIQLRARQPRYI